MSGLALGASGAIVGAEPFPTSLLASVVDEVTVAVVDGPGLGVPVIIVGDKVPPASVATLSPSDTPTTITSPISTPSYGLWVCAADGIGESSIIRDGSSDVDVIEGDEDGLLLSSIFSPMPRLGAAVPSATGVATYC